MKGEEGREKRNEFWFVLENREDVLARGKVEHSGRGFWREEEEEESNLINLKR
jgi:hypothetical protein